jgi:tetratricopeptide (TPR) repeat protein
MISRGVVIACLMLSWASDASATTPPNDWDAVRDPALRERYELHAAVSRLFEAHVREKSRSRFGSPELADQYLLQARTMLELADAAHSPDAQLRFDVGRVYQLFAERSPSANQEMFRRAAEVLDSAVTMAPTHPATEDALLQLATCYARFDTQKEVATYERLLAVAENPRTRAVSYLNRSEALMRLGHLDQALEDARYAVELDASPSDTALANMDLAVELDRYGDGYGARKAAEAAVRGYPEVVHMLISEDGDRSVFFVPDYDKHWYRAAAVSVLARACAQNACIDPGSESQAVRAESYWRSASIEWDRYLALADVTTPWLGVARKNQADAKKRHADVAAKLPKPTHNEPFVF